MCSMPSWVRHIDHIFFTHFIHTGPLQRIIFHHTDQFTYYAILC